jgi:hypothetical protein
MLHFKMNTFFLTLQQETDLVTIISAFCFRQRVCDSRNSAGAAPAERGQLPDPVAGRGRPAGGVPGDAAGRRLRGLAAVDFGPRAVRHVDLERRPLLHRLHPAPGRHRR